MRNNETPTLDLLPASTSPACRGPPRGLVESSPRPRLRRRTTATLFYNNQYKLE